MGAWIDLGPLAGIPGFGEGRAGADRVLALGLDNSLDLAGSLDLVVDNLDFGNPDFDSLDLVVGNLDFDKLDSDSLD